MKFNIKDVQFDTYRTSGARVCDNDNCVKAVHMPTGIFVLAEEHKSQHRNRKQALEILREKVEEKSILKDAIGQTVKIKSLSLFLDLDIILEEECIYQIGITNEDEKESGKYYGAGDPSSTNEYFSDDADLQEYISHCIFLDPFLKTYYKDELDVMDYLLVKEIDFSVFIMKLCVWLGKNRKLLKTESEDYQWIIEITGRM